MSSANVDQLVERHSIEHIPATERHGRPRDLFTLWFASNVYITCVVTGAVAVSLGLSLFWSVFAVVVGNLIGGVFMAYHSVQGPRMGLPQMIQSRAQFGSLGAILPMLVTVVMYLGFQVEGNITLGKGLAAQTGLSVDAAIVLIGALGVLTALFGYQLIHLVSKVATILFGLIFAAFLVKTAIDIPSAHASTTGASSWPEVVLAISIFVSWQITWAPYVSDYSRYLPENTSSRTTFWYTYAGSVLTAVATMMIGVFAALEGGSAFGNNPLSYLTGQFSWLGPVLFWTVMVLGFGGASGPYGAFLTACAAVSRRGIAGRGAVKARAWFVIAFVAVSVVISWLTTSNQLATYEDITNFLLYLLVPWTAINLVDYFIVRRGSYDIDQLLDRNGIYGLVSWRTVTIYSLTIAVELLFANSTVYEGPVAHWLQGADVAWLVGLIVAGGGYYLSVQRSMVRPQRRDPVRVTEPTTSDAIA